MRKQDIRKQSIAQKNIIILVLSFLPFIIGLSYSVYKKSDNMYLSKAINISGSQRMRTMLIANYSQQLSNSNSANEDKIREILSKEIDKYETFYYALIEGNKELNIKRNKFKEISSGLTNFKLLISEYIESARLLLNNKDDENHLNFIVNNAMLIKNNFHESTGLFQEYNDKNISTISIINLIMIIFAFIVTIKGFLLSKEIKIQKNELLKSEEKYRLMIENSGDAITIRQKRKFVFVNEALAKMLDYPKEELLRIDNQVIFHEEMLEKIEKHIAERKISDNSINRFELPIYKKDGSKIDVEISERIVAYNNEKAQFAVFRDITKQKEIIEVLKRGAEQTKGLKEFIPICASCYLIRDDEKEDKPWMKPADYITERLPDIKFSHSICPDCMKELYKELEDFKDE